MAEVLRQLGHMPLGAGPGGGGGPEGVGMMPGRGGGAGDGGSLDNDGDDEWNDDRAEQMTSPSHRVSDASGYVRYRQSRASSGMHGVGHSSSGGGGQHPVADVQGHGSHAAGDGKHGALFRGRYRGENGGATPPAKHGWIWRLVGWVKELQERERNVI